MYFFIHVNGLESILNTALYCNYLRLHLLVHMYYVKMYT